MRQEGYVNEAGQPIVHKQIDPRKLGIVVGVALLGIMLIVFIVIMIQKRNKNNKCTNIEEAFANSAFSYAKSKNILPVVESDYIVVDSKDLTNIVPETITNGENKCSATIKIMKYKEDYIKTVETKNCGYCTTSEHYSDWKTTKKKPERGVYEAVATYNYYETTDYYSKWTTYILPENISTKKSKYGNYLPLSDMSLPTIPKEGHIVNIDQEKKTYYSYQDQLWKYYKDNGGSYSSYSSTQPAGYSKKDISTLRYTAWSDWSLNYPDVKSYRSIKNLTGYRWYYKDGKKKVYWKSGEYYPTQPSPKYTEKDSVSAIMYSYRDSEWRWYNGTKRTYSAYISQPSNYYPTRDSENTVLSSWSAWSEKSSLTNENSYFRTERTQERSRYRIKYQIYSLLKLDNYVDKNTLEQKVSKSLKDFALTPNIKLEIKYTYRYRKVK